jgi:hypothetical protein
MKKLLLAAFALLITALGYGQKVDLDKYNFTFEYRDLPRSPLDRSYNTFSVVVNAPSSVRMNYSEKGLEQMVNIEGWKKLEEKGHVIVEANLDDLIISSSAVKDRFEVLKDKDGKETGKKYYYWVEATYTWNGKMAIKDYKGNSINTYSYGTGSSYSTWKSSEYGTYKEAADYYNNNKYELKGQLVRTQINDAFTSLNGSLSTSYGYSERKDYEILWIMDSKKHAEHEAQQQAWATFKEAVASIKSFELPDATREKLTSLLGYFDNVITKYPTEDKGDKKLRYASFYNKAKIYLYLDNPEKAIEEADKLIANKYDEGDGKRIKKEAESLIELFKKNEKTSRHFSIDVSSANGPL